MERAFNFSSTISKIENFKIFRAVRDGLVHIIPVLIIGAFSVILLNFPVEAYQTFIGTFLDGFLEKVFSAVNSATFGVLSVYMAYSIARSFMKLQIDDKTASGGAIITSLLCFFIMAGAYLADFEIGHIGVKSMFLAIISGLGASASYVAFYKLLSGFTNRYNTVGSDRSFNRMLSTVLPIAIVTRLFALLNTLVTRIFDVDSFRSLISKAFNALFSIGSNGFFKGFFFVMLSSLLWFFGIHGSDTLEDVMQEYFYPGLSINQNAIAANGVPTEILTKEFFDCFVLMGGCGATICLLIAILIFSKNRARKGLGLTAAFPMIFNINELMVFGLPIIFNPIMLIPFLAVPLVCYSIAYVAIATGIVPMIVSQVDWTTPILLGGYYATGSIAGSILQLVNVAVGVLIYLPFVRMLDKQTSENAKKNYDSFMEFFKANEQTLATTRLIDLDNVYGEYAKDLCNDLRYGLKKQVVLAYQPQYHYDGKCIGVEALLRFEHPLLGMLYPPLIIKLAEEGGFLPDLEERILLKALEDRPFVQAQFGEGVKLSVNVTGTTVVTSRYIQFCQELNSKDQFEGKNICIEITEQAAISFNDETRAALLSLRDMGLLLAIDDFSMGQTSINYLRDSMFDIIKLDGSLVKGIFTHQNTRDIVSSIVQLATSLNLMVLAEYVDTEEKRSTLHEIGCDCYQGYLFSPAVFLKK